jgi:hypothetical protein
METRNSSSRNFIIGAVAGVAVALAVAAGFLFAGAGDDETAGALAGSQSAGTAVLAGGAPIDSANTGAPSGTSGGGNVQPEQPAATATPVVDDGEGEEEPEDGEEEEEDDPTPTPTPDYECQFCLDGDIAAEPTPADPCPFCNDDIGLAQPQDTPPSIGEVTTSFCYPNLVLKFELEDADFVWFSYTYNGSTHESQHIDADTFQGWLSKDMSYLDWGVYLITNLRVNATDEQGHHVWSDPIEVPDPDLACE